MAVKIRLTRHGAKKKPFYRIVVAESRFARDGLNIAILGYYNPLTEPKQIHVNAEETKKWLSTGAQPSETVKKLLKKSGVID